MLSSHSRASMIYGLQNQHTVITGVGQGSGPSGRDIDAAFLKYHNNL